MIDRHTASTEKDAVKIALAVFNYWLEHGYVIDAQAVCVPSNGPTPAHWTVKTNLVNGLPPRTESRAMAG